MQPMNPIESASSPKSARAEKSRPVALLFVRGTDDVVSSLRMVNRLLAHRGSSNGEVIGVVVGRRPDGSLPEPWAELAAERDVGLRESVGVAGIWSLAWYDVPGVESREERWAARMRLLDLVARSQGEGPAKGAPRLKFFPVLASSEGPATDSLVQWMKARYPALGLIRTIFVDEPSMGGIVSLEGAGGLPA